MRKPRLSDAPEVFEYSSDPEVTKFMVWKPAKKIGESKKFLKHSLQKWKEGENFLWMITRKNSDKSIGNIELRIRDDIANFGYILSKKEWGKGYMTEVLTKIIKLIYTLPEVKLIWGACDSQNKGSIHVMEKAGMKFKKLKKKNAVRNISKNPRDTKVFILRKK